VNRRENMRIDRQDLVGVCVDENELACMACVQAEELDGASADDVLTRREVEDGETLNFCDRCKGRVG